jgi:hypothetical protein
MDSGNREIKYKHTHTHTSHQHYRAGLYKGLLHYDQDINK